MPVLERLELETHLTQPDFSCSLAGHDGPEPGRKRSVWVAYGQPACGRTRHPGRTRSDRRVAPYIAKRPVGAKRPIDGPFTARQQCQSTELSGCVR